MLSGFFALDYRCSDRSEGLKSLGQLLANFHRAIGFGTPGFGDQRAFEGFRVSNFGLQESSRAEHADVSTPARPRDSSGSE